MEITEQSEPGQNRFWSITPFENDQGATIRVNQLIDHSHNPPIYFAPRIEISAIWLHNMSEAHCFEVALSKAKAKLFSWTFFDNMEVADGTPV